MVRKKSDEFGLELKEKTLLIQKIEEYSSFAIFIPIFLAIFLLGALHFNVIFGRAIIGYIIVFTIGPWVTMIGILAYISARLVGWLQEGKFDYAVFGLITFIAIIFFFLYSGLSDQMIGLINNCTIPIEKFFEGNLAINNCPYIKFP